MSKELEAFEALINKFAEQMIRANKEELIAINKTNAIEYLYRTPQVRLLQQALTAKSKKEQAFDYLIKHFNIECDIDVMSNGKVWGRFINIQAKEDKGTYDTTATANLVDYEDEFNLLKEVINND